MSWGWIDDVFTTGSKYADELGSYSIKLASDLAPYGIKNVDDLAKFGIKNSDELLSYIKNSDIGKLAFSNTLKNPPNWLKNIIPPNLTKNLTRMGIKNLDDVVKFGFKSADDLKKLGVKNSNDLVKIGVKNVDDLVKVGIKNADDLVKVGIKNADDLAKVGIKNADDLAKVGIKNANDLTIALNKANSFGKTLKKNWKTILTGGALTVGGIALFSEGGREAIAKPLVKEMTKVLREILGTLWESIPEEFKQYATFLFFIIIGLIITSIINSIFVGNLKTAILVPMWLFIFWTIISEWTFNDG